jgi:RecB family exonuclease
MACGDVPSPFGDHRSPLHKENETGQGSLFGGQEAESDYVHPNLREWAMQAPAIDPQGKLQLSASAIQTYAECPLKFKYAYYARIPTGAQAALTFGSLMHQSVRHYFRLRQEGVPALEAIQEFYLRSWKDQGFEDTYQEQTYKKAGLDQLREFVERHNASALAVEGVALEQRFTLELDDVVLEGRIDQINPLAGSAVELIDYKTGRPRSQKDADKSLQLSIYALAARRQLRLDPVRLTFYNLTNNQPVSTVRSAKSLDQAVAEIREVAARIRSLRFAPQPGFACKYCDFIPICPAHEEET